MRLKKWNVILAMTWMLVSMLATVWMTGSSTPSYAQSDDDGLAIDTTARARDRSGNVIISESGQGLLTVTINLEGQDCPTVPRERPVDVVLVVDVSSSMTQSAGNISRIDAVKASIAPFLSRFNLVAGNITSDQIAVVVFGDSAAIIQDFNRDANTINADVQALNTSGQTNMAAGFTQARYLLEGRNVPANSPNAPAPNRAGNAVPVIVMLTDGAPSDASAVEEQVRLSRISLPELQIATIAFGESADRALMRQISDTGKFFEPNTDQQLLAAFDQIATLVQPKLSATDVRVEYTLNNNFILGDIARISPPPTTITTNSIIWEGLGDIYSDDTLQFTFEVEARAPGTFDVGTLTTSYLSCGETTPRIPQISGPQIIAQVPTATPSPTNTPTPTITPTSTITPTPPPTPVWTNPEDSSITRTRTGFGVAGALCEPSPLDWIPIVIALILLLIALWIIRRGYKNLLDNGSGCRDVACWLIRSAFLLWLVFVIFLFLQPLMNTQCLNLMSAWRSLLPWLLPLLILGILMLLCLFTRNRKPVALPNQAPPPPPPPPQPIQPKTLDKWSGITELWKPQPALIIGVGVAGWHVLTQIKKGLVDAGIGTPSEKVRLLCIMAKDQAPLIASDTFTGTPLADYEIVRWQDTVLPIVENAPNDPTLQWVDAPYLKMLGDAVFNPQSGLDGANRQLGRLALINNLRGNNRYTQQNVVDYLDATINATAVQGALTAIIISDLSDDVGAGAVLDIAALIRNRHKQQGGSTTRLIGHFMTARATNTADLNKNSAVNTVASLRELERFQLATNAPFHLRYGADPSLRLDVKWDGVLFDEVNLHDGNMRFGIIAPQLAVYPAIADSILLWLDESSHKDLYAWVNGRKNNAKDLQAQRRQMIVGGMGVYQYRLPFADILEDATVRYARQLLLHLISGREGNDLSMNAARSEEVFLRGIGANISDPVSMAKQVMRGVLGYGQLSRPWAELLSTFAANNQMEYQRVVNGVRPDLPADADHFDMLLKWVLLIVLNGEATPNPDHMQKKGAKLAFGMSFIEAVRAELERYQAFSAQRPEVMNALEQFSAKMVGLYKNLEATQQLLIGNKPSSVRLRLDTRKTVLDNRNSANQRLRTRRYITTMPKDGSSQEVSIADEWYATYLSPNIRDGMSQFVWQLNPQGEIALTIKLPQREQDPAPVFVALTENTAPQFELALLELGRYFARKVRDDFNISGVLAQTILRRDTIEDTANTLMNQSLPLLAVSGKAPNQSVGMVFSANATLTNRDLLLDLMRAPLTKPEDLQDLKTGDPFTITLARTLDSVPIDAVAKVDNDVKDYLRDVFIQNRNRPTAVFNAERNALIYEGQLSKIKQAHRILHPLVVTALAHMRQTEVYLIAAAVASMGDASAWSEKHDEGVVFNHPDTGKLSLSASNVAKFFPLLDGLLTFTQVVDDTIAEKIYRVYKNSPDMLDSLYEWSQTDGEAWRKALLVYNKDVPNADMERVLDDLIAIAKILAVNLT